MTPEELVNNNLGLVGAALKKHSRLAQYVGVEESKSIAYEAYWAAARNYDPSRGSFSNWVFHYIWGYLTRAARLRRTRPDNQGFSLDEARAVPSEDRGLPHFDEIVRLRSLVAQLPDTERRIISECVMGGRTFTAVARELGISTSQVYTLRDRGLERLRSHLSNEGDVS